MGKIQIFMQVLNMSLAASLVIIVVFISRMFMKRLPRKYSFLLWLIVDISTYIPTGSTNDLRNNTPTTSVRPISSHNIPIQNSSLLSAEQETSI